METHIRRVLHDILRNTKTTAQALFAIQQRWKGLVGKDLAAHTKPVSLRRRRLTVFATQPGDSFTLNLRREELRQRIQTEIGCEVEEIILRPGAA